MGRSWIAAAVLALAPGPAWAQVRRGVQTGQEAEDARPLSPASLAARIAEASRRGASRLAALQKPAGYWEAGLGYGDPQDPVPTRVAVTAVCVEALEEAGFPEGKAAAAAGLKYVLGQSGHRPPNDGERPPWNHRGNDHASYAWAASLSLLARHWAAASGEEREALAGAVNEVLGAVAESPIRYTFSMTGDEPATFQVAWLVCGLLDARAQGFRTPSIDKLLLRLLEGLDRSRQPHGGFGYKQGSGECTYESTVARNPVIELALSRSGRSMAWRLDGSITGFLTCQESLARVPERSDPHAGHHVGPHRWAPYYYLFGAYWAAAGLARLGPDPKRSGAAMKLAEAVLELQGEEGDFVDSSEVAGPAYGTAMALRALKALEPLLSSGGPAK